MIREKLKESLPIIFSLFITIMLGVNVYDGITITGNSFWYVIISTVNPSSSPAFIDNSKSERKSFFVPSCIFTLLLIQPKDVSKNSFSK